MLSADNDLSSNRAGQRQAAVDYLKREVPFAAEVGDFDSVDALRAAVREDLEAEAVRNADAAVRAAYDFDEPAVAIIKHTNPCGIAVSERIAAAHAAAHATDPVSAFGGVIAANRPVDADMARQVADVFTEVVVAPDATEDARMIFESKKNLRLLLTTDLPDPRRSGLLVKSVSGRPEVETLPSAPSFRPSLQLYIVYSTSDVEFSIWKSREALGSSRSSKSGWLARMRATLRMRSRSGAERRWR